MSVELLDNLQVFKLNEQTKEDVLETLSEAAISAGYAKPGYNKAILDREAKYPTGLHTPQIEVAIPHADAEWANAPSLTIGLLESPVIFQPMGAEGGEVNAEIVFMLTIKDPKEQINFLRAFSTVISNPKLLTDFKNSGNHQPLIDQIKEKMG